MFSPKWLIIFPRDAFYSLEINENLLIYIGDFAFEIRARAVRHVITRTRELPVEKRANFINRANPLKKYRPVWARAYHNCVEFTNSVGKDSVQQKSSF